MRRAHHGDGLHRRHYGGRAVPERAHVGHVNYADTEKYIHLTRAGHAEFLAMEAELGPLIPKAVV